MKATTVPFNHRREHSAPHRLALVSFALLFAACSQPAKPVTSEIGGWTLAYSHTEDGTPIEGSKQQLIDAVRNGKPIRVYVKGRRVEHAAEAYFLTIFEGDVFAQVGEIQSQQPVTDPTRILFREAGTYWRATYGSNGTVTALMDGTEQRKRTAALSWFSQN